MGLRLALRASGLAALFVLPALLVPALPFSPLRAQGTLAPSVPFNEVRALNMARNTAVNLNGGLGVYRPAGCMFSTEAAISAGCLVKRDEQGFFFRFLGGPPGWEQLKLPATVETELQIAPDGRSVVKQTWNGTPR
jgi:hypothetical protein